MKSVTEKAMLIKLNISQWSASKHDRAVSDKVAADHGAQSDMGRYSKRLIAKDALDAIKQIATQARHYYYENTLPWLDDGARVMPAANYFTVMAELRDLQHRFDDAAGNFVTLYPGLIKDARGRLGKLFNESDYPGHNEISNRFRFEVAVEPLPSAEDFRVDLGDEERAIVQAQIEARVNAGVEGAMTDLWQRIHDHVQKVADRLRNYNVTPDGKVEGAFRDSLIGNLRDLIEVLPRLNFTSSNSLEDMRRRLETELCSFEPQQLRDDDTIRNLIAQNAEAILQDVGEFLA